MKGCALILASAILANAASTIMTTTMILKNVFSSKMRSRSSSGEKDSIDSYGIDLKDGKIGQGHCHIQNCKERSSRRIDHPLASSTPSLGDFDEGRLAG